MLIFLTKWASTVLEISSPLLYDSFQIILCSERFTRYKITMLLNMKIFRQYKLENGKMKSSQSIKCEIIIIIEKTCAVIK